MADLKSFRAESLFNVKGWVAIVTGGGTGLGLMTANALAANGCKVYITGRRTEVLRKAELRDSESGGSINAIQADVTDIEAIKQLVKTISEKESHVNLLVNNAGVSSAGYGEKWTPAGDPQAVSDRMLSVDSFEKWSSIYKVNVSSLYFTSVAFLPLLCAARDHGYPEAGNIINISSISGITKGSQWGQFRFVTVPR